MDIAIDDITILLNLPDTVTVVPDPYEVGVFLRFTAETPLDRHIFSLGEMVGLSRFTCCHRYEPFWMTPKAGTRAGEVPIETQYLLVELDNHACALFIPLVDGPFRATIQGVRENGLELVAETGDRAIVGTEVTGLFVAVGDDPFELLESAAPSVAARMGIGRLRLEKSLPDFIDQFGWCTWDAFYQDVSHDKVREGLQSFAEGGVTPKTIILDDGWQSVRKLPSGETRMTAFAANAKFPDDLGPTVTMCKGEFDIETFIVWHAMTGYWGGVDGDALPGYAVRPVERRSSPGILHYVPTLSDWWGPIVGLVSPDHIYRFFNDYHRHLREQGVDGLKVDTQATLESIAQGSGGRVSLMRRYHEALEGSAHVHFDGTLINCMSCANEMYYSALNSNITRTSTDFWPDRPASHGLHLYCNAQVSAWFGEFTLPDWDMFQSAHAMGPYHAAGRAVGGCPVYVSDKPDAHNFDVLRKLVLPDGSVLRCSQPGKPTRDCLFHDPTSEAVLLKIQNTHSDSGILGVFNARYGEDGKVTDPITGVIRPSDVTGLEGDRFAVYAHNAKELRVLALDEAWEITLPQLEFEVFNIVPISNGFAPIGLADMFNSAGAVISMESETGATGEIMLQAGGRFVAWCASKPSSFMVDEEPFNFTFDASSGALEAVIPGDGWASVRVTL